MSPSSVAHDATAAVVVCDNCGDRDTAPITSQFGRQEWDVTDHGARMLACLPLLGIDLDAAQTATHCVRRGCAHSFQSPTTRAFAGPSRSPREWADTGTCPDGVMPVRRALLAARRGARPPAWDVAIGLRCIAEDADLRPFPNPFGQPLGPICREQFGTPFAAPDWNPAWLTSTVRDLAAHIYATREFTTTPILADALQDAGCDDEQILTHCRGEKPHARGCWVLDAILGKT